MDTVSAYEISNSSALDLVNKANTNAGSNPVKSMRYATAAVEKSINTRDESAKNHGYNSLGSLYYNIGNYGKALEYFRMASDGFAKLGDYKSKAISDKYILLSNNRLAEANKVGKSKAEYKTKSKTSKSDYKNTSKTANSINLYNEIGLLEAAKKDTVPAPLNNLQANSKDQIIVSANKSETYQWSFGDNIKYQNEILKEGLKRKDNDIVSAATYNLGSTYVRAEQPDEAVPFLMRSIEEARKSGDLEQQQKAIRELSMAYEKMGKYDKALETIKNYVKNADSLTENSGLTIEQNLALNEEFLKQEQRITKLIATQKEKEVEMRRQQILLWGLSGILLIFGVLTWMLVRNIRQKQKANMQIKLQSLRAQMNPHFIFNSLNSVNNFISKNDERSANKYLADFSKLMRTVLKNSDQDFVSLDTEIDTLRIYLDLEHFRFGDKFDYTLEVDDAIEPEHVQIPPMLIQPYIENAVWHGLRYKENKGLLQVRFFIEDEKLFCTVRDNGIGRKKSAELKTSHQKTQQSTGIKNTKERIELLNKMHGTRLQIQISDIEEQGRARGTMVKISLPHIMQLEEV